MKQNYYNFIGTPLLESNIRTVLIAAISWLLVIVVLTKVVF